MEGTGNAWKWIVGGGCALMLFVGAVVSLLLVAGIGVGVSHIAEGARWRSHESVRERSEVAAKAFLDHVKAGNAQAAKDATPLRKMMLLGGGVSRTADKLVESKLESYTISKITCEDAKGTTSRNGVDTSNKRIGISCTVLYDAEDASGRPWFGGLIYWIVFDKNMIEDHSPDPLYIMLAGAKQGMRPEASVK